MKALICFDFDETLTQEDSLVSLVKLRPEDAPAIVHKHQEGWLPYMKDVFAHLLNNGVTKEEITQQVANIPLVDGMEEAIKVLGQDKENVEIIILSDANTFIVETRMKAAGLDGYITKILSNRGYFSSDTSFVVEPFHENNKYTECGACPKNMCKAKALKTYIKERGGCLRFVAFVGDSNNDFCAIMTMTPKDVALVRKNYPLEGFITFKKSQGDYIKARMAIWNDGTDVLESIQERMLQQDSLCCILL